MGDLIDRDDAIIAVKVGALSAATLYGRTDEGRTALYDTVRAIKAIPSAQPEIDKAIHDAYKHGKSKGIKRGLAMQSSRWIPCSERLPEYDKPVLLSTAWGKTEIGFWTQRGWMIVACSYREFEQGAVAAWMSLPEPYEEQLT